MPERKEGRHAQEHRHDQRRPAHEDFATAEQLGVEFGEDLRLMEDLGWDKEWRDDVDLTMAPADLAEILKRLRAEAEGGLKEPEDEREVRERRGDQAALPVRLGHL